MASPLPSGKSSVNLGPTAAPGSRIRRDPPPPAKKLVERDPDKADSWTVIVGILTFELALFVIIVAISSYNGWTPRHTIVHF